MPRLLFIGAAVADVIIRVPRLPRTGDDLIVPSQGVRLGGCACNACRAALASGADAALFAPVGTGVWGDFVRASLQREGILNLAPDAAEPNGCCYCLVEPDGDRSFLCSHGAEYKLSAEKLAAIDGETFDAVYFCGLDLEEDTGDQQLAWLEAHRPPRLYFAPGPRLQKLPPRKMAAALRMAPVLHLSENEACAFAQCVRPEDAAARLHSLTGTEVVITLGARGSLVCDGSGVTAVPGRQVKVIDTVGAGDAHIGALMAAQLRGLTLREAAEEANRCAALTVSAETKSPRHDTAL